MKNFIILIVFLTLSSCVKRDLESDPIDIEKIYGKYYLDAGDVQTLILNKDSTYKYTLEQNNKMVENEKGVWRYRRGVYHNYLILYKDRLTYPPKGSPNHQYYASGDRYYYACSYWGAILLGQARAIDPDGAPAIPWLKKQ
ncbi:MAG: hypothetical protein RL662_641 [Bacteroidota bacterium]|jgi:hypothetical protein